MDVFGQQTRSIDLGLLFDASLHQFGAGPLLLSPGGWVDDGGAYR